LKRKGWEDLKHDLIPLACSHGYTLKQANTLGKRNQSVIAMACDRQ
jgi:hypothetical protein